MRKTINLFSQAYQNRHKGYFLFKNIMFGLSTHEGRELAETILDACDKVDMYKKDYVIDITNKGTLFSAPWHGEDTSSLVVFCSKIKKDSP